MEVKKSKKADLNQNSGLYFVLGLVLVMVLVWVALEWKTYDEANDYDISMDVEELLDEEVPMTEQIKTPPPPPPPAAPEVIEVVEDEEEVEETVIESTETSQEEEVIEVDDIEVEEVEEDIEVPFAVIEDVPICFQQEPPDARVSSIQPLWRQAGFLECWIEIDLKPIENAEATKQIRHVLCLRNRERHAKL